MRTFVPCSLGLISFAMLFSGGALAQSGEEEIIVRGKPLDRYRAEVEAARDEMIRLFNEANEGEDNDVRCRDEAPTGSRIPVRVCFSAAQDRLSANGARDFLHALTMGAGSASEGAATGIASAQSVAAGERRALTEFADEWRRVMSTNQPFHDAVVEYRELENEFNKARGATIRIPTPDFTPKVPRCRATTYTEYEQIGSVARVAGTVSTSACPAGTTGKLVLVARLRDDTGTSTRIEFSETWQTADMEDYVFHADYRIGEDVFLESVHVRNLKCTCELEVGERRENP